MKTRFAAIILGLLLFPAQAFPKNFETGLVVACTTNERVKQFIEIRSTTNLSTIDAMRKLNSNNNDHDCSHFPFILDSEPLMVRTITNERGTFAIFSGHSAYVRVGDSILPLKPKDLYYTPSK
jgi:hypothetical protein